MCAGIFISLKWSIFGSSWHLVSCATQCTEYNLFAYAETALLLHNRDDQDNNGTDNFLYRTRTKSFLAAHFYFSAIKIKSFLYPITSIFMNKNRVFLAIHIWRVANVRPVQLRNIFSAFDWKDITWINTKCI